jgi:hypothetical protein
MPPRIAFGGLKVAWQKNIEIYNQVMESNSNRMHIVKTCNTLNKRKADYIEPSITSGSSSIGVDIT